MALRPDDKIFEMYMSLMQTVTNMAGVSFCGLLQTWVQGQVV